MDKYSNHKKFDRRSSDRKYVLRRRYSSDLAYYSEDNRVILVMCSLSLSNRSQTKEQLDNAHPHPLSLSGYSAKLAIPTTHCKNIPPSPSPSPIATTMSPKAPYMRTTPITRTRTRERRGKAEGNSPTGPTNLHQPIGFICCCCRYRSSGSNCSNPEYPACPHRTAPRCKRCAILFTGPARRHGGGGDG